MNKECRRADRPAPHTPYPGQTGGYASLPKAIGR
jgi:hypothetical protein